MFAAAVFAAAVFAAAVFAAAVFAAAALLPPLCNSSSLPTAKVTIIFLKYNKQI